MKLARVALLCLLLTGCKSVDPIVGTWKTVDNTSIVLTENGHGTQTFEKEGYFELNGTYDGSETPLTWKKKEEGLYIIYYHYEDFTSPNEAELKNGDLIFDQGDYLNILKRSNQTTPTQITISPQ